MYGNVLNPIINLPFADSLELILIPPICCNIGDGLLLGLPHFDSKWMNQWTITMSLSDPGRRALAAADYTGGNAALRCGIAGTMRWNRSFYSGCFLIASVN